MPGIAIARGAKVELLQQKFPLMSQWSIFAFRNNYVPLDTSTAADFTVEPNARFLLTDTLLPLNSPIFNVPFVNAQGQGQSNSRDMDIRQINSLLPVIIYGWYMLDVWGYFRLGARFTGLLPKVIHSPLLFFRFRIEFLEDSIP